MTNDDKMAFAKLMADVFTYYGKDLPSASVVAIYWEGLKPYDMAAIRQALGMHAKNPDTGSFLPKIADVEKMLGGTTTDAALVAIAKVERAMSGAGAWRSVVFDDALIHTVVTEMGGWAQICMAQARDWEFRRTEFLNRYRGYRMRSQVPTHPPKLIGLADANNAQKGFAERPEDTMMVGDRDACAAVLAAGTTVPLLAMSTMAQAGKAAILALEGKK